MDRKKRQEVEREIRELSRNNPYLCITFSGGKDSTAMVFSVLNSFRNRKQKPKKLWIVYSNTLVEPPPLLETALRSLNMFKELGEAVGIPIFPKIVYPELKHRFWVLLIGKGYAPPSVRFRWCSEKMKIRPVREFIRGLKTKYGEYPVVLTGVRLDEGSNRKTSLLKRVNGKWMPYEGLQECSVFAPLLDFSTEDIWSYIEYNERKWNVDLSYLRELYSIAFDGINNFRTGCWVCTLIRKDKSLTKLSEKKPELKALVEFRDFLYELRANKNLRMWVTRFGKTYKGPLKFEVRRFLFEIVKSMNWLTIEEEMKILEIWKESGFIRSNRIAPIEFERCRNCDLNYVLSLSP